MNSTSVNSKCHIKANSAAMATTNSPAHADPSAIRLTDYPSSDSEQESETQPTSQVNEWALPFGNTSHLSLLQKTIGQVKPPSGKKRTRRTCTLGTILSAQVGSPALSARGRRTTATTLDIMCLYQYLYFLSCQHSELTFVTYCGQAKSLTLAKPVQDLCQYVRGYLKGDKTFLSSLCRRQQTLQKRRICGQ